MKCDVSPRPMHILLVDDEPDILEEMAEYLDGCEIKCTVVTNGRAAIKALRDPAITHMILDMRMEGVDGLAVLRAACQRIASGLKVAAVSGHAGPFDERQAREHGAEVFFKKPVDMHRLVETFLASNCGG